MGVEQYSKDCLPAGEPPLPLLAPSYAHKNAFIAAHPQQPFLASCQLFAMASKAALSSIPCRYFAEGACPPHPIACSKRLRHGRRLLSTWRRGDTLHLRVLCPAEASCHQCWYSHEVPSNQSPLTGGDESQTPPARLARALSPSASVFVPVLPIAKDCAISPPSTSQIDHNTPSDELGNENCVVCFDKPTSYGLLGDETCPEFMWG